MTVDIPASITTPISIGWHSQVISVAAPTLTSYTDTFVFMRDNSDIDDSLGRKSVKLLERQIPSWSKGEVDVAGPDLDIEVDA